MFVQRSFNGLLAGHTTLLAKLTQRYKQDEVMLVEVILFKCFSPMVKVVSVLRELIFLPFEFGQLVIHN